MDSVVVFAASYLIWIMVAGFAAVWIFAEDRRGKLALGLSAVLGLLIVLALIKIASASYYDPRPFVQNAAISPLIPHAPDNGFPSDHSSAAGLIAVLVALRHRFYGLVLAVLAAAVAWARTAAKVHHLLDVAVGLALGAIAAGLATLLVTWLLRRFGAPRSTL